MTFWAQTTLDDLRRTPPPHSKAHVAVCVRQAQAAGVAPGTISVPVVGGHAGITILPLLSQCTPPLDIDAATVAQLTERVQNGGTEVSLHRDMSPVRRLTAHSPAFVRL
jgi:malate/lactate dehydrogenase